MYAMIAIIGFSVFYSQEQETLIGYQGCAPKLHTKYTQYSKDEGNDLRKLTSIYNKLEEDRQTFIR